jgi:hypothetical protein
VGVVGAWLRQAGHAVVAISQDFDSQTVVFLKHIQPIRSPLGRNGDDNHGDKLHLKQAGRHHSDNVATAQ